MKVVVVEEGSKVVVVLVAVVVDILVEEPHVVVVVPAWLSVLVVPSTLSSCLLHNSRECRGRVGCTESS